MNNYIENATLAMEGYNNSFYRQGDFIGSTFWNRAEILELIEDAYEILQDDSYKAQIKEICSKVIEISTVDWSANPFYDDIAWMCLAFIRAASILEDNSIAEIAKNNMIYLWENARDEEYGGMYWRRRVGSRHTVTVCPFSITSCLLARYFNDNSWYDRAVQMMDWELDNLYFADGGYVYDHVGNKDDTNYIEMNEFSYNFGTFIGACSMLYEYTNDTKYSEAANNVVEHLRKDFYMNELMTVNVEDTYDASGFIGILVRWLRYYATKLNHPEIMEWLKQNADLAWSNRNKQNIMTHRIANKASDYNIYHPFSVSSAMSILVNCI